MTENSPQDPIENPVAERSGEDKSPDQRNADDAQNPGAPPEADSDSGIDEDPDADEETDVDEVEQELLDAMEKLRRTNKQVEQYLDGLSRDVEKPMTDQAQEQVPEQNPDQVEKPAE